jgi:hypothetical protein
MTKTMLERKKLKLICDNPINLLGKMMQTMRPSNSKTLYNFIDDYILPLGATLDHAGNAVIRIGDSKVLWSSHTDTVHRVSGHQRIVVNGDMLKLGHGSLSNCLGADCTTGVWLMREMILNNVAGLYVFHDSEEIGGIGSSYLAKHHNGLLDGIDYAIAFDRKGYDSIITHQSGGRCASDTFAKSLAKQLPNTYETDDTGTFTDTANYTGVIGECTNISVGYFAQHTANETQSISHALELRDAMLRFDESKLVKSRNAGDIDPDSFDYRYGNYDRHYKGYYSDNGYYDYGFKSDTKGKKRSYNSFYDMVDYIQDNADAVADMLDQYGITLNDIIDHVEGSNKG